MEILFFVIVEKDVANKIELDKFLDYMIEIKCVKKYGI